MEQVESVYPEIGRFMSAEGDGIGLLSMQDGNYQFRYIASDGRLIDCTGSGISHPDITKDSVPGNALAAGIIDELLAFARAYAV